MKDNLINRFRVRLTSNYGVPANNKQPQVGYRILVESVNRHGEFESYLDVGSLGVASKGVFLSIRHARSQAKKLCSNKGWPYIEDKSVKSAF